MATELINSASDEYVHTLLSSDTNIVYVIPKYQREYSWGKWQWEDLIRDLQEDEEGRGHFLGTIICINTGSDALKPRLELVDGQQRMTTLSILIAAILEAMVPFKGLISDDDDMQQRHLNLRSRLLKNGRPRLELQREGGNHADFEWLLTQIGMTITPRPLDTPKYWGVRRIAQAFKYFRGELARQLDELPDDAAKAAALFELADRISKSVLVKLEVKDHSSAFTLFESLNNRGMDLSPIDLIKNSMLMRADRDGEVSVDDAYVRWMAILADLGPSAGDQERFLRYYFNAFEPIDRESGVVPEATRSNLIKLYEEFLDRGLDAFLSDLAEGAREYGRIVGTAVQEGTSTELDRALKRLQRAQGANGNALLMFLMVHRERLGLDEGQLQQVANLLTSFFVRRNVTSLPSTYELSRIFRGLIHDVQDLHGEDVVSGIRDGLARRSSDDETFRKALEGPLYADNVDMARFLLSSIAESAQTAENRMDLWERTRSGDHERYVWTIEHIFPQGDNIPEGWQEMMGGPKAAKDALATHVHRLGNLTLTGYNSALGNKSFQEKRDREDTNGNYVGYRNGIKLNEALKDADSWSVVKIEQRTEALVDEILTLFPLNSR